VKSAKTAFAVQHLILAGKISEAAQNELVDVSAKQAALAQLNPSNGALVLLCHAGFSTARFSFLKGHVDNLVYMASTSLSKPRGAGMSDRISINADARAGLFAGLKALMGKKVVLLSPDGKQGSQKCSISVLGKQTRIGDGAAFLAYESKCDTFWFSMNRSKDRFVPVMIRGPARLGSESFPTFEIRFVRFYEKMLNDFFSGDPRNLLMAPRWAKTFDDNPDRS
jgi:lauroyl/myristoyl acyltransferase